MSASFFLVQASSSRRVMRHNSSARPTQALAKVPGARPVAGECSRSPFQGEVSFAESRRREGDAPKAEEGRSLAGPITAEGESDDKAQSAGQPSHDAAGLLIPSWIDLIKASVEVSTTN